MALSHWSGNKMSVVFKPSTIMIDIWKWLNLAPHSFSKEFFHTHFCTVVLIIHNMQGLVPIHCSRQTTYSWVKNFKSENFKWENFNTFTFIIISDILGLTFGLTFKCVLCFYNVVPIFVTCSSIFFSLAIWKTQIFFSFIFSLTSLLFAYVLKCLTYIMLSLCAWHQSKGFTHSKFSINPMKQVLFLPFFTIAGTLMLSNIPQFTKYKEWQ